MKDPRTLSARLLRSLAWRLSSASDRIHTVPGLAGDRTVEWAWSLGLLRTEPGRVLDFGAGNGLLSLAASFRGHEVIAVDLQPCAFEYVGKEITYRQGDFNELEFEEDSFDQILNCSTIEHVGLEGRYGAYGDSDGDLRAMNKLARLLRPDGDMILTLPLGVDAVFAPYHRVYGAARLPALLAPFTVREESCWAKIDGSVWEPVERDAAIAIPGSSSYYALGLFQLAPN